MFIWQKQNTLDQNLCSSIIQKFEIDSRKTQGRINGNQINTKVKKSSDLYITNLPDWKDIDTDLKNTLHPLIQEYTTHLTQINRKLTPYTTYSIIDTGYQIQKTNPGDFFDWHDDDNFLSAITNNTPHRRLTFIWYLNNVTKGGETEFITGEKITPEVGKFLLFPPHWTFLHRGVTPEFESKYICTGWVACNLRP